MTEFAVRYYKKEDTEFENLIEEFFETPGVALDRYHELQNENEMVNIEVGMYEDRELIRLVKICGKYR